MWDGAALGETCSFSSRTAKVIPIPKKQKRDMESNVINSCESDDSFDVSIEEPEQRRGKMTITFKQV